jgi:hypothetical protein
MRTQIVFLLCCATVLGCADSNSIISGPQLVSGTSERASLTQADGTPVMTGLANSRGLAWGPEGALYVVEAGRGGKGPCLNTLGQTVCYGPTGAVSRLWHGHQERVVSDLPSWVVTSNKSGQAQGPAAISFNGFGNGYVTIALEADPTKRTGDLRNMATLVHLLPSALSPGRGEGRDGPDWEIAADLGQYELDANPDCGVKDSNPFGVLAVPGGALVTDASANSLVRVDANGDVSTVVAFPSRNSTAGEGCPPNPGRDFVPTAIVQGPDGAYYIGHLNGLPILAGTSTIWRLEPGGVPQAYCSGFTWIIAMAFDRDGNIYALQYSVGPLTNSGGSLLKVAPDCSRQTLITGLKAPAGVAVDDDGNVYVSVLTGANAAGESQVRRFTP